MRAVTQVNRPHGAFYDPRLVEASVTNAEPVTPPVDAPAATPEQVQARAEKLVDAANDRGNLQLSDADHKAIVDQVVTALGPMIGALSEEDVNTIVDQMIERMAELGAFSPAPTAPGAAAPSPEVAAEAAAEVAATQAPPEKLTWAEKHFPNR